MTKDEVYLEALAGVQVESQKDHQLKRHLGTIYSELNELAKHGLVFELEKPPATPRNVVEWPKWIDGQVYESESAFNESRPKDETKPADEVSVSKADSPILSKPLESPLPAEQDKPPIEAKTLPVIKDEDDPDLAD